jgi:hypothetical protein
MTDEEATPGPIPSVEMDSADTQESCAFCGGVLRGPPDWCCDRRRFVMVRHFCGLVGVDATPGMRCSTCDRPVRSRAHTCAECHRIVCWECLPKAPGSARRN